MKDTKKKEQAIGALFIIVYSIVMGIVFYLFIPKSMLFLYEKLSNNGFVLMIVILAFFCSCISCGFTNRATLKMLSGQ